jgi:hypothetical protein
VRFGVEVMSVVVMGVVVDWVASSWCDYMWIKVALGWATQHHLDSHIITPWTCNPLHHNTHHHNTKPHGYYFVTVLNIICGSSLLCTPDDGHIDARNMLRWINFIVSCSWIITLPSFTMHGHMNVKFPNYWNIVRK